MGKVTAVKVLTQISYAGGFLSIAHHSVWQVALGVFFVLWASNLENKG